VVRSVTLPSQLKAQWRLFRRSFPGQRRRLTVLSTLAVLSSFLEAAVVLFVAGLASIVTNNSTSVTRTVFGVTLSISRTQFCVAALGMVVARGLAELALVELKARTEAAYERQTRERVARAFLRANWSVQFGTQASGLHITVLSLVSQGRNLLQLASDALVSFVGLAIMVAVSISVAGRVTAIAIASMAVIALSLHPFIRRKRHAAEKQRDWTRTVSNSVSEMVSMAKEIRVFAIDQSVSKRLSGQIKNLASAQYQLSTSGSQLSAVNNSLTYLAVVGGLIVLIASSVDNPQTYVAMVLLLYRALIYGRGLQSTGQNIVGTLPFVEELDRQLTMYEQAVDVRGSRQLTGHISEIAFEDVSYAYVPDHPALRHVSFVLKAGDTVGIVGPSGSGKSTIVQLLLALRRPTDGRVTANGVATDSFDAASWASKVTLVPQEALLFDETVEDNVRCFRDGITHEDVVHALEDAQLLDEMSALPDGLATVVGEGGKRLSGGQRQRLCIARALAGKPDLLILDEPTSALDPVSEEAIRQTLERLKGRMTIVIVAHRMSTLRICDRVMVVGDGRLEASGERRALEQTNEYYAEALRLARLV
jgi:ATP-binding cassette subfamily B protein